MSMNRKTSRLVLFGLVLVCLAFFSHALTMGMASGTLSGQTLENAEETAENRHPTYLSCEVDNPEPALGDTITFSGYLRTADDNLGRAGENITICLLLYEENLSLGSTTTDENGYFTLSLGVPGQGIYCYRAQFAGNENYENSESNDVYSITLDKSMIFGGYAGVLIAMIGVAVFFLRRGIAMAHYMMPVLMGFAFGFLLLLVGAGLLGILAAGLITGYLFAKNAPEWTKHARIGCVTGLFFLLAMGLISAYSIIPLSPEDLATYSGTVYSVTQGEIFTELFISTVIALAYFSVFLGFGAVLGGMLRKILKREWQKPSIGSGETTSSGVEQG
jgi:hypothetical protein